MRRRWAIIGGLVLGAAVGGSLLFITPSRRGATRIIQGHDLGYWLAALEADDGSSRRAAIRALPLFGEAAAGPVALHLGDVRNSDAAVEMLTAIGAPAVPSLIDSLKFPSAEKRCAALKALDQIGAPASAARTKAAELLRDDATAPAAAQFLASVGPNMEAIVVAVDVLDHGTAVQQLGAVRVLSRAEGNDGRVAAALQRGMHAADHDVRFAAFRAVCSLTPPPPAAAADVLPYLQWIETQSAATEALQAMGSGAIEALRAAAVNPSRRIRMEAVTLLGALSPRYPTAEEALRVFESDPHPDIANAASAALTAQWNTDLVMTKLRLRSADPTERLGALRRLVILKPLALTELCAATDDGDEVVSTAARNAIADVWSAEDSPLLDGLEADDRTARILAVKMLAFRRDPKRVDAMIAAVSDPAAEVRLAAVGAMRVAIGSPRIVAALKSAARDRDAAVASAASVLLAGATGDSNAR